MFLTTAVQEKEARIKEGMLIMGMRPSVFWTGWAITAVITSLYVSLLVIASGNLCAFLSPTFCLRPAASSSRRIISQAFTLFSRCLLFRLPSSRSVYTPSASLLLSSLCTQSQIAQILEGDVTHRFPHFSLTCVSRPRCANHVSVFFFRTPSQAVQALSSTAPYETPLPM
jgi:hypothetical protein